MREELYIETPVFRSHKILNEEGKNVYYKMDCYQQTGSFKIRGMDFLCRHHVNDGKTDFVASSGGNAGYSLAFVGKAMGVNIDVIVPKTTPEHMIEKIKNVGGKVEVIGDSWNEADVRARNIAEQNGAIYVSPFDDPLLWKGHSTIIDECAKQIDQPDKIIVSVGGGGLLCGIFEGMDRNGWSGAQVITTETLGAASFSLSYHAKEVLELKEIDTIASSLSAKKVAEMAFELSKEFDVQPFLMSDKDALSSCHHFLKEYNVLVEPACGAALSVPYLHSDLINENETALVIVCGGVGIQMEDLIT